MLSTRFTGEDIFGDMADALLSNLTPEEMDEINDAITENYEEVWSSRGRSVNGRRWENNVDLVQSGRLRSDLTSGRNLRILRDQITISTTVPYASFVESKYPFMDLSAGTLDRIAKVYTRYMSIR